MPDGGIKAKFVRQIKEALKTHLKEKVKEK